MKGTLLIKGKNIFDGITELPEEKAVVVEGKKIIFVGDEAEAKKYTDENTKIIDAGEKLVTSGIMDSHVHLILSGMPLVHADLGSAKSEEETAKLLYDFEQENPSDGWVIGFNWYHVFWDDVVLPTAKSLDKYFPDRPVFLFNAELHGVWVNSKAMELAGITKDTEDPFGGTFYRDEEGNPTGYLDETALGAALPLALDFPAEREAKYLKAFMDYANSMGITAVNDMQPYFGMELGNLETYSNLEKEDKLTLRIHAAKNLLIDLDELKENKEKYKSEKVRANLLKQFLDGVSTGHTALMIEDYDDAKFEGDRGTPLFPLEDIRKAILGAHEAGFSIRLHSCGDLSARYALDYYEEAVKMHGFKEGRHGIEHIELMDESDMPRVKELKVIPSMQPEHIALTPGFEENPYRVVMGEERAGRTWPLKTMLEQAGVIAIGSDAPVVDCNIFNAIFRATTRLHNDMKPEGGWNPTEKLTMAEVLRGYTYGGAYAVGREDEMGSIKVGNFADFAIFDRNLFDIKDPKEIFDTKVEMTVMDGKIIFERK